MPEASAREAIFLSSLPAGPGERRLAAWVLGVSIALFIIALPLAKLQLPKLPSSILIYETALIINDLITPALLFGQYCLSRSRAPLPPASGPRFTPPLA